MKELQPYRLFLVGLCIGFADLIPGISGSTVALLLGLYGPILAALGTLTPYRRTSVPWLFLLPLGAGIATGILTLVHLVHYLLSQPTLKILLYSGFIGLVAGSTRLLAMRVRQWNPSKITLFATTASLAFCLSSFAPAPTDVITHSPLWIFTCGMIGISTALLPGISGSYCLTVLGIYPSIIQAIALLSKGIAEGYFPWEALYFLTPLALGILSGAIIFSRLITWTLHNYHDTTTAAMAGLMVGTLRTLWPLNTQTAVELPMAFAMLFTSATTCLLVTWLGRHAAVAQPQQ